jgi:protocatechuate 3,4-dioxygenase beta subunit
MKQVLLPLCAIVILASLTVSQARAADTANRPDLHGAVKDAEGKPISDAHVWVYTAGVKKGTNPLCPSCYADCSKKAVTDDAGAFTLPALDPELQFTILVQREGYKPLLVRKVDPAKGPMEAKLESFDWKKLDPKRVIRGRVVDAKGDPVAGAELSASMFKTSSWGGYTPGIFDPVAVTNLQGEFVMTAKEPIEHVTLEVKARGLAPIVSGKLTPERTDHELRLGVGVAVTGKLLLDGKPVPRAGVGLVQVDRGADGFLGHTEIATNESGEFRFDNVHPDIEFAVYSLMHSLKKTGATSVKVVRTGKDDTTLEAGALEVVPVHRLTGKVTLSDGKSLPPDVRVMICREVAWDHQNVLVSPDGSFSFEGLPAETYTVSIRVPGYRLSEKNASYELLNNQLLGRVDGDVSELRVLLDPGKDDERRDYQNRYQRSQMQELKTQPLRGAP